MLYTMFLDMIVVYSMIKSFLNEMQTNKIDAHTNSQPLNLQDIHI